MEANGRRNFNTKMAHEDSRNRQPPQAPWKRKEELLRTEQEVPQSCGTLTTEIESSFSLRARLETLHCHFTWNFESHVKLETRALLQTLTARIGVTPYPNQAPFYNMRAYLYQREGRIRDALRSLQKAEEILKDSHKSNFKRSVLVTYGNYAWIYYYMPDYAKAEQYLDNISDIYQSLNRPTHPLSLIPEIYSEIGWSLLVLGYRNGEEAAACFEKALAEDPNNKDLHLGLSVALYAATTSFDARKELTARAKAKLQEVAYREPANHEVRVCLMLLLWDSDKPDPPKVAEGAAQNNGYRSFFRETTCLRTGTNFKSALQILKQVVSFEESNYVVYKNLGSNYWKQLGKDTFCWNPKIFSEAIQDLKANTELVPTNALAKIRLAEMYRMTKELGLQEEIYSVLQKDLPNLTQKEQQSFFLSYGKFQVYQMDSLEDGAKLFLNGFNISRNTNEGQECRRHLWNVMHWLERDGKTLQAAEISKHIQTSVQTEY